MGKTRIVITTVEEKGHDRKWEMKGQKKRKEGKEQDVKRRGERCCHEVYDHFN